MVIALFALAFAMIVGGLLATILGWDIVLVERGWTMVIAGTVSAASGALLLGVTAVVSRLSRIHTELTRLQANLVEDEAEEAAGALPTAAGVSAAALAGGLFGRNVPEETPAGLPKEPEAAAPLFTEAEPRLEEREEIPSPGRSEAPASEEPFAAPHPADERERVPEPDVAAAEEPYRTEEAPEEAPRVKLPDFLFVERFQRTTYTEVPAPIPEREEPFPPFREAEEAAGPEFGRGLVPPAPEPALPAEEEPAEEEPVEETAGFDTGAEAEEAAEPPAEARAEPEGVSVIGSYTSGENRYVMYSDGSIEAETPRGVFKFQSLDELKAFIATGEGGTRLT